jgi:hypothetical protein
LNAIDRRLGLMTVGWLGAQEARADVGAVLKTYREQIRSCKKMYVDGLSDGSVRDYCMTAFADVGNRVYEICIIGIEVSDSENANKAVSIVFEVDKWFLSIEGAPVTSSISASAFVHQIIDRTSGAIQSCESMKTEENISNLRKCESELIHINSQMQRARSVWCVSTPMGRFANQLIHDRLALEAFVNSNLKRITAFTKVR